MLVVESESYLVPVSFLVSVRFFFCPFYSSVLSSVLSSPLGGREGEQECHRWPRCGV